MAFSAIWAASSLVLKLNGFRFGGLEVDVNECQSLLSDPTREFYAMTLNVSLTPQLEELVRQKVSSGRYNSASEVVREALRLMDTYESLRTATLAKLKADVEAGWQQVEEGKVRDFDPEDLKRRAREKLKRQQAPKR